MIFSDTGAWFGLAVPSDPNHKAAQEWFRQNREPLITTDFVIDETLTLLRARGETQRALQVGRQFFNGQLGIIHRISDAEFLEAWRVFERFSDKGWSFTDCTSKVVMESLGIIEAFAFDEHFRQFGSIIVRP